MFSFIKKLLGITEETETGTAPQAPYKIEAPTKPQRTRKKDGKFIANDPVTSYNEAWRDGKSQAKKSKTQPKKSK